MPEREGGGVLRVKAVFSPSLGGLIFPPRGKPTGDGRFRAKGLWDARGDSRDGDAQIRPTGPSDCPAALPGGATGLSDYPAAGGGTGPLARPGSRAGTGAPGWFRRGLTFLVVAALSAAAGVGATRVVQHLTAAGPAAAGMPGTAAADRQENLND